VTETLQLVADDRHFYPSLLVNLHMLEVAATALASEPAGCDNASRRWVDDLDQVGVDEAALWPELGDPDYGSLPRDHVADEEHLALVPRDEVPAVGGP
jgi:hypothetical protein